MTIDCDRSLHRIFPVIEHRYDWRDAERGVVVPDAGRIDLHPAFDRRE
jgi:hypothetical protein